MSKKYLDDVGTGILVANMKQYVDDSLTIVPIEKITDFGGGITVTTASDGTSCTRLIDLNAKMVNPSSLIFKCSPVANGTHVLGLRFIGSDGERNSLTVISKTSSSYLFHIINDSKNKMIIIYEIYYGNSFEISYDDDGNFVSKTSTANVTSYNILTKLNSKTSSGTYTPSSNTDVATKEYVDNSILEIEDLSSEDITALFSS